MLKPGRNTIPAGYLWRKVQRYYTAALRFSRIRKEILTYGASRLVYSVQVPRTQYLSDQDSAFHWVFLPSSRSLAAWHTLMYLVLLWNTTVGTFSLCLLDTEDWEWLRLVTVVAVLCPLDILVSFFSAYKGEEKQPITDPLSIAKHYLRTWLLLDLVAAITVFNSIYQQNLLVVILLHFTRVVKLAKHSHKLKLIRRLKLLVGPVTQRILLLLFVYMLSTHVLGCLWYLIPRSADFPPESWVVRYDYMDKSALESYVAGVYFIWTTLATVGTGDIAAFTLQEQSFVVVLMAFGVGFLSYTISSASTLLNQTNASATNHKLERARDFAQAVALPTSLLQEILLHLRYAARQENDFWQHHGELKDLPLFLASELSLFMHHRLVAEVSFFQDKEPLFISEVVPKLRVLFLEVNKEVYRESSFPDEVYFLRKGRVVLKQQGVAFVTYVQGSYFGEEEVIWRTQRICTAQTETTVELLTLQKRHFLRVLEAFPAVKDEIIEVAHLRQTRNVALLRTATGDLDLECNNTTLARKKSMRQLKQRENYRVNWRRLNTLEQSGQIKWDSVLRRTNTTQIVSASRAFVPRDVSLARRNFIRRKRRSVLVETMESNSDATLLLSHQTLNYVSTMRRQSDLLETTLEDIQAQQYELADTIALMRQLY